MKKARAIWIDLAGREGKDYRVRMTDVPKKPTWPQIATATLLFLFLAYLLSLPIRDWLAKAFPAR